VKSVTKTIQQDPLGDEVAYYVEQTDRATLESRRKFCEEVYQPRRDELAKAWSALSKQARSL